MQDRKIANMIVGLVSALWLGLSLSGQTIEVKPQSTPVPISKPASVDAPALSVNDRLELENAQLRANVAAAELKSTPQWAAYQKVLTEQGQRIQGIVRAFEKAHPGFSIDAATIKVVEKKLAK